jgi:recombination protein RecA
MIMSASQVRAQIEAALAQRIPSALTPPPRPVRPKVATRIAALDEILGGGLPVGAISEIAGQECTGRTTVALSFLAQITQQEKVCAWVDVSDSLDPESAAASGIDLDRMLWVRCGRQTTSNVDKPGHTGPYKAGIPTFEQLQFGGTSPHPRSESKTMPQAVKELLDVNSGYKRDRSIGTPSARNRLISIEPVDTRTNSSCEEQPASDRLPARRGVYALEQRKAYDPRCYEPQPKPRSASITAWATSISPRRREYPAVPTITQWSRLEQGVRVTDLLLQSGGFAAIVLDMGSVTPECTSCLPLATWFRYRAVAAKAQTSLLILTQCPAAKSSAEVVLLLGDSHALDSTSTVFAGLAVHARSLRRRFEGYPADVVSIKKPPKRAETAEWQNRTAWTGRSGFGSR